MASFRLIPTYRDYLWGGDRLTAFYGKTNAPSPLAESWELSMHPDGPSCMADGRTLEEALTPVMLGENATRFAFFPLLVKLIDAARDLSVQVHPSDAYAMKYENSYGKTEMWYIVDATEGAGIYLGFRRDVTEAEIRTAIAENTLIALLRFVPVRAGECYFIPAGTVHAIGAGCLICEIQQNSNLTYRLYDYGRRDANGNTRPLHIDKALAVMHGKPYTPCGGFLPVEGEKTLGISRYFHAAECTLSGDTILFADHASFRALVCTKGEGTIDGEHIRAGDTYLIPAGERALLSGTLVLVSVSVRRYTISKKESELLLSDDLGRVHAKASSSDMTSEQFLSSYGLAPSDVEENG